VMQENGGRRRPVRLPAAVAEEIPAVAGAGYRLRSCSRVAVGLRAGWTWGWHPPPPDVGVGVVWGGGWKSHTLFDLTVPSDDVHGEPIGPPGGPLHQEAHNSRPPFVADMARSYSGGSSV